MEGRGTGYLASAPSHRSRMGTLDQHALNLMPQYTTKNKKIMERCSKPRWGLEAPDPIDLIFKEKMGVQGLRPQVVSGGSLHFLAKLSCTVT
ncbi:hypothetical protein GCM10027396_12350 [Insolitispirillum peregrinum]